MINSLLYGVIMWKCGGSSNCTLHHHGWYKNVERSPVKVRCGRVYGHSPTYDRKTKSTCHLVWFMWALWTQPCFRDVCYTAM